MKILLMFLLMFSSFAEGNFAHKKEKTLARMREKKASPEAIACVEKAEDRAAMKKCKKGMKKKKKEEKRKRSKSMNQEEVN